MPAATMAMGMMEARGKEERMTAMVKFLPDQDVITDLTRISWFVLGDHNQGGKDDGHGNDWFSVDKSMDLTRSSIGDHDKGGNKGGKDDGHGKDCLSPDRSMDITCSSTGDHNKGGNKGGKDDGHGKTGFP
jgi:hypothetical protein